jgi:NTP pyrophosphatase (non-canonical NTP hydrolase)
MNETPESILEWSRETFGARDALTIAIRASKEVNEAMCAILNDAPLEAIHDELADCAVMIWQVASLLGVEHRPQLSIPVAPDQVAKTITAIQLQRRFTAVLDDLAHRRGDHSVHHVVTDALKCLELLALAFGIDLDAHVTAKMRVNRARVWQRLENGSFQHVVDQSNGAALPNPA